MIINLTAHPISIIDRNLVTFNKVTREYVSSNPVVIQEIPASGTVARCTQIETEQSTIEGIPTIKLEWGTVTGLPEPESGKYYVVSQIVKNASPMRNDLLVPTHMVKDTTGRIVGCLAFAK